MASGTSVTSLDGLGLLLVPTMRTQAPCLLVTGSPMSWTGGLVCTLTTMRPEAGHGFWLVLLEVQASALACSCSHAVWGALNTPEHPRGGLPKPQACGACRQLMNLLRIWGHIHSCRLGSASGCHLQLARQDGHRRWFERETRPLHCRQEGSQEGRMAEGPPLPPSLLLRSGEEPSSRQGSPWAHTALLTWRANQVESPVSGPH